MSQSNIIANLLCTRLCHDLTGPISAINNGAELLEEDAFDMQDDAIALILSSAKEASARLQFYRLAYGHIPDAGEASLLDKREILDGFFSATKTKLDWSQAGDYAVSYAMMRLTLNVLIIASQSLIRGGMIAIRQMQDAAGTTVVITATGESMKVDPANVDVLNGTSSISPSDPKNVQLYLTLEMLSQAGATLALNRDSDSHLELKLHQPVSDAA